MSCAGICGLDTIGCTIRWLLMFRDKDGAGFVSLTRLVQQDPAVKYRSERSQLATRISKFTKCALKNSL